VVACRRTCPQAKLQGGSLRWHSKLRTAGLPFRIVKLTWNCQYSRHDYEKHRNASTRDLSYCSGNPYSHRTWHRHYHWCAGAACRNFYPDRALAFGASPKQFRHLPGELGTDSALLMLEINERIFPHCLLFADEIGPAANIVVGVVFAA
jgi:hypothetical protein